MNKGLWNPKAKTNNVQHHPKAKTNHVCLPNMHKDLGLKAKKHNVQCLPNMHKDLGLKIK
jgi:hypothetical protein